jgi:hypothetical protein
MMNIDFALLYSGIVEYLQSNIFVSIGLAAAFLLLLFKKTKQFLVILLIVAALLGSLLIISSISDLGYYHKKKLVREETLEFGLPEYILPLAEINTSGL